MPDKHGRMMATYGRRPPERSRGTAAVLSFIFPGLGHAYLGDRRGALLFAVPVLVLLGALLAWVVRTGFTRAGARLLDPTVAQLAAVVALVVLVWWALAVLSAWRAGAGHGQSTLLTPVALVAVVTLVIVAPIPIVGPTWYWQLSVADRGFDGGVDCTISDCNTGPTPAASQIAQIPTGSAPGSATSGVSPTPSGTDEYAPDLTEPPATIEPGPSPSFDISKLDAQDDGWLNVLLIGLDTRCAGGVVTGANTDTMIVVSANAATGDVYMFSFPRDTARFPLYVGGTMPGYWKLNSFAGFTKLYQDTFPDPGQPALAYEIGYLLGIPIDYYASINICGFPQLIDQLGGVDVCNSKTIDDPGYPHGDGTYGFHLDPGMYHMDGATALAYARSRHGSSDFARAKRQQQLLGAIKQAILAPGNLARLPDIVTALGAVVHTDFPPDQIDSLLQLANQVQDNPTAQYVFEFPDWAQHLPRNLTNGRSVQFLRLDKIAALSEQVFGSKSLYSSGGAVPSTVPVDLPTPSPTPTDDANVC